MINKKELLSNLREYSSDQIAEAINSGVVTLYELSKSGNLTPLMRRRIGEKLSQPANSTQGHVPEAPVGIVESETLDANANNIEESLQPSYSAETPIADNSNIENETDAEEQVQDNNSDDVLSNKGMFKRPFSFKGRIRRLEYGLSIIIYYVAFFIVGAILGASGVNDDSFTAIIYIMLIPAYWFLLAQGAKRCHDRGKSGWYQIIPFYSLWMLFGDGEEYVNDYGADPKGRNIYA